MKQFTDIIIVD